MLEFLSRHAHRFLRNNDGNFAVLTALAMVPLLAAASVAVDYTNAGFEADKLQEALDSAALRAVRLYGEGQTEAEATQVANDTFFGNWDHSQGNGQAAAAVPSSINILYTEAGQQITAAANYSFDYQPVFLTRLSFPISRHSSASYQTGGEACILALNRTADRAFEVSGSSTVDTSGCTITANSSSNEAIYVGGSGTLKTECLYTPGKVSASPNSTTLACGHAHEGSSVAIDPFKRKTMPAAGQAVDLSGCGQNFVGGGGGGGTCNGTGKTPNKPAAGYAVTLKPGTYAGLEIKGNVKLQPGNYIIDGGTLKFASQSVITGDQVTFFLLNGASIDIHGGSTFNVTAATSGAWAGFSIVADRSNTAAAVINGNSSSHLNGIIYMPAAQEVQYAGNGGTGGECVRIIAQEITMIGNSTFKLDCKQELADNQINSPGAIRLVQ
ncbi:TadE/TadG family type IV pilus assembly protein [Rhizobium sp. YTU87027]|uniref:TadE/TadG family type IV pilus assembly protein n=1 Tax=Rhizobium sp. YTU87027 TaxID=3417741 RepID=UPI003D683E10